IRGRLNMYDMASRLGGTWCKRAACHCILSSAALTASAFDPFDLRGPELRTPIPELQHDCNPPTASQRRQQKRKITGHHWLWPFYSPSGALALALHNQRTSRNRMHGSNASAVP